MRILYLGLRFIILYLTAGLAIEDYKTSKVLTKRLYATSFLQAIAGLLLFNFKHILFKMLMVIFICLLYHTIPKFKEGMGDGDVQYICGQLFSYEFKSFEIFWISSLLLVLIQYCVFPKFKKKYIPMFPAFLLAEIITISLIVWRGI